MYIKGKLMRLFTITMLTVAALSPEMSGAVEADPNMPKKEGFDTDRAIFWRTPNFVPLRNPDWRSLSDARRAGDISDSTPVLVFEAGGSTLVLVSSQMAYHHVAQGDMNGEPWMVTF